MENRPEFLAFTLGLTKMGITIALLNTNITGSLLIHAMEISKVKAIVISSLREENWKSVECESFLEPIVNPNLLQGLPIFWFLGQGSPSWTIPSSWNSFHSQVSTVYRHTILKFNFDPKSPSLSSSSSSPPPPRPSKKIRDSISSRDPLFYIFTSGTSGVSKAAKFSHKRFIGAAVTWSGPSQLKTGDAYYITLPLYHG